MARYTAGLRDMPVRLRTRLLSTLQQAWPRSASEFLAHIDLPRFTGSSRSVITIETDERYRRCPEFMRCQKPHGPRQKIPRNCKCAGAGCSASSQRPGRLNAGPSNAGDEDVVPPWAWMTIDRPLPVHVLECFIPPRQGR